MAVINVRVEDEVRDSLKELADAEGISLSEYVRDLLREAVLPISEDPEAPRGGDEPAPESLRWMDRKVLSMLHRILARVLPEDNRDGDGTPNDQIERARVLEQGFAAEYWLEAAGFSTELSKRDSRRVNDILEMFRIAAHSISQLKEQGVKVEEDVERRMSFRGFDFNHPLECQMGAYVKHLVADDRWAEVAPFIEANDGGNSHYPMLDTYTRMLAEYRRLMSAQQRYSRDDFLLSHTDLLAIADAALHPSNRGKRLNW